MKTIVKKYYKDFLFRGVVFMGGGPLVLAIIYGILDLCGVDVALSGIDIAIGIITVSILAFITAGITIVYQIEELPITKAIATHGIVLYAVYATVYLINGWLKDGYISFIVFTCIFIVGYLVIWGIIYLIIKRSTEEINNVIRSDEE